MISGIYFHVDVDLEYDWQPHVALVSWHSRSWGLLFLSIHGFLQSSSYENVSVTEKSCSHIRTVCWLQVMQGNMVFHTGIWDQCPLWDSVSPSPKWIWRLQGCMEHAGIGVCNMLCVHTAGPHHIQTTDELHMAAILPLIQVGTWVFTFSLSG